MNSAPFRAGVVTPVTPLLPSQTLSESEKALPILLCKPHSPAFPPATLQMLLKSLPDRVYAHLIHLTKTLCFSFFGEFGYWNALRIWIFLMAFII